MKAALEEEAKGKAGAAAAAGEKRKKKPSATGGGGTRTATAARTRCTHARLTRRRATSTALPDRVRVGDRGHRAHLDDHVSAPPQPPVRTYPPHQTHLPSLPPQGCKNTGGDGIPPGKTAYYLYTSVKWPRRRERSQSPADHRPGPRRKISSPRLRTNGAAGAAERREEGRRGRVAMDVARGRCLCSDGFQTLRSELEVQSTATTHRMQHARTLYSIKTACKHRVAANAVRSSAEASAAQSRRSGSESQKPPPPSESSPPPSDASATEGCRAPPPPAQPRPTRRCAARRPQRRQHAKSASAAPPRRPTRRRAAC